MLQGRFVRVVGQVVPLGKNRANCTATGGSEAAAAGEADGVGVAMFLGYLAVPLTWMVWFCWLIWARTRGTRIASVKATAISKYLFLNRFTSKSSPFFLAFICGLIRYKIML